MRGIVFEELPRIPLHMDEQYDYLRRGPLLSALHRVVAALAVFLLRIYDFLMFGLVIRGWENRIRLGKKGAVAVCNHVHTLDCTMMAQVLWPKRMYFVTLQSNLEMKGVRHFVRLLGGIPIPEDRALRRAFPRVLAQALALGAVIPIYPEGELAHYCPQLRPFHKTAFATAWRAGVPVLPMCITYRAPRGIWRFKKRPCLTLHILPAVEPDRSAPRAQEIARLQNETQARMRACIGGGCMPGLHPGEKQHTEETAGQTSQ